MADAVQAGVIICWLGCHRTETRGGSFSEFLEWFWWFGNSKTGADIGNDVVSILIYFSGFFLCSSKEKNIFV